MIRPTCAKCMIEMSCDKNDVAVVHFTDNDKAKGIDALRYGDAWKCPKCDCRIIVGMGKRILGYDLPENFELKGEYIEIKRK